jgi:hypothetical protein
MALPVRLHTRQLERAIAQTAKIEPKRVYLPVSALCLETFEAEIAGFPMSKSSNRSIPWCSSSIFRSCRLRANIGSSAARQ